MVIFSVSFKWTSTLHIWHLDYLHAIVLLTGFGAPNLLHV